MPDLSLCSGESSVLFIVNLYFLQYIFKNCLSNGKGLLGGNKLKNPVLKYGLNYSVSLDTYSSPSKQPACCRYPCRAGTNTSKQTSKVCHQEKIRGETYGEECPVH